MKKLRLVTFIPPFLLLLATIVINFINEDLLITTFTTLNTFFMSQLGWLASIIALACLILLIVVALTPLGNVRLGGKKAKPNLSNFNWFCISLTTTLASGLLILSCKVSQNEAGEDCTPWFVKALWGAIVALIAGLTMALMGGYDGIRVLSNIGGIVAVFLILGMVISMAILLVKHKHFNIVDYPDGPPPEED